MGDAVADEPSIDLELRLALAEPAADASAGLLAHEVAPHPAQAREHVLELRELDLEPPLPGLGVAAEDVEDERRAVDHLHGLAQGPLEVALLGGGELLVEDHDVHVERLHGLLELQHLARADEGLGHGAVEPLREGPHDVGAVGVHEAGELGHGALLGPLVGPSEVDAHEKGTLARQCGGLRCLPGHGAPFQRPASTERLRSSVTSAAAPSTVVSPMGTTVARPSRRIHESCRLA